MNLCLADWCFFSFLIFTGAYAGSWTPEKVISCTPTQFGGYPAEKTIYNNSTLRVFNMLIEASNQKEPTNNLGTSADVLNRDTVGNGHVSRNIRLALLSVDMVEPYVAVVGVDELALTDDIVPMTTREPNSCRDTKAVIVDPNTKTVDIEWTVGGAMTIDTTELWYGKWDDVSGEVDCWTQPSAGSTDNLQRVEGAVTTGTGYFSAQGSQPRPEDVSVTGTNMTNGPLFRATIPLENFQQGDKVVILASARVDQSWKNQPSSDILPKVPPQSHIVNARTDPSYYHESNNGGKQIIQGRLDWFSVPLTIVIGGDTIICKDQKGKIKWKPKSKKRSCKWIAKKKKCDKTFKGEPLWTICPKACERCTTTREMHSGN